MALTLDQIRVLDAIDRLGTFARAAASLHRVPSAVSYAIRKVEVSVGFAVFDRRARTAVFTAKGRRLLSEARVMLEASDRLDRLTDQMRSGWESELHVVVDGALPLGPVLRGLQDFADPDVPTQLRLDVEYKEGVVHRFQSDDAQLMLVIGFDADEDTSGYTLEPMAPLELRLVASPSYEPSLHAGLELSVRDSRPGADRDRPSFSGARDVAWVSDFHTKRTALLEGVGFGWMPEHLVRDDLDGGRLVVVPDPGRTLWTYQPQIVRRADLPLGRGAELFLRHLRGLD
ncbi:MAG: LysR family transcriptional regulator [Proteobacteria bacterium]|nr:LysR family transcriptional regulator [Pseudomonadota bacterium]